MAARCDEKNPLLGSNTHFAIIIINVDHNFLQISSISERPLGALPLPAHQLFISNQWHQNQRRTITDQYLDTQLSRTIHRKYFYYDPTPVPPSGNLTSSEYKNIKYLCSLGIFTDPASGAGRKSFINCLQWLWRWTDPYRVWIRGGHSLCWMHLHLQLAVRMETQVSMALMKNVPMGQESVTGTE